MFFLDLMTFTGVNHPAIVARRKIGGFYHISRDFHYGSPAHKIHLTALRQYGLPANFTSSDCSFSASDAYLPVPPRCLYPSSSGKTKAGHGPKTSV
jgi:hypothetical protein